jgi:hypothetical protein
MIYHHFMPLARKLIIKRTKDTESTPPRSSLMKNWGKKLEAMAVAVAFSEAGEWQTARTVLEEADPRMDKKELERKKVQRPRVREQSYRL